MNERATIAGVLEGCGGVGNRGDLARRWGITMTRIHQLTGVDDFPAPVVVLGEGTGKPVPVYSLVECDRWREGRRGRGRGPSRSRSEQGGGSRSGRQSAPGDGRSAPRAKRVVQPAAPPKVPDDW